MAPTLRRDLLQNLAPAGLTDMQSAAYVGVSLRTYKRMRAQGLMPQPRIFRARNITLREELDAALRALPTADGSAPPTGRRRVEPEADDASELDRLLGV